MMKNLTPLQIGYICAAFDGEGTIGLARSWQDNCWKYRIHCEVNNSNMAMLEFIKQATGFGTIRPGSKRSNPKHKPVHTWELNAAEAKELLPVIQDHLVIKQEQALLLLEFLEGLRRVNRGCPLTQEESILKSLIYEDLAELNRRGLS